MNLVLGQVLGTNSSRFEIEHLEVLSTAKSTRNANVFCGNVVTPSPKNWNPNPETPKP